jgi:hypothetical protein
MSSADQPRGGRRRLNILSCIEGYKGTNAKGSFTLYNIECADPETGVKINAKFNSFAMIPLGIAEYDLQPYMKDGVLQSWTIQAPKGTQSQALAQQVSMHEERIKWLEDEVNGLKALLPRALAAGPSGSAPTAPPDDDVPF